MITIEDLSLRIGSFSLERVQLRVSQGDYGVLMGRTGCGKTTLLESVAGLKKINNGRIVLRDRNVTHLRPAERGIGYVPQDGALFSTMTVREHLAFALIIRQKDQRVISQKIEPLAELLGIGDLLERRPAGLSGGERQRVALGRALSFDPTVLLLDEPLSALDDETRQQMYEVIRRVRRHTGVTTLHVTHNQQEAAELADVRFEMAGGSVREMNE